MNTLQSTTLNNWKLDRKVSDTDQISDYIEKTRTNVSVVPEYNGGEKIATITINGESTEISSKQIDIDSNFSIESTNPVQNKIITNEFKKIYEIVDNGAITDKLSTEIEHDRVGGNGGFYGICDADEVVILGTYQSGLMYYDKSTKSFHNSELTAVPEGFDLDVEKTHFHNTDDGNGAKFKTIKKLNGKYIAIDVSTYKPDNGGYVTYFVSDDGIEWELTYREVKLKHHLNDSIVFYNGKYYASSAKNVIWSQDLKTWSTLQYNNGTEDVDWTLPSEIGQIQIANDILIVAHSSTLAGKISTFDLIENQPVNEIDIYKAGTNYQIWSSYADKDIQVFCARENRSVITYAIVSYDNFKTYELRKISDIDIGAPRGILKYNRMFLVTTYNGYLFATMDWEHFSRVFEKSVIKMSDGAAFEGAALDNANHVYIATRKDYDQNIGPFLYELEIMNDQLVMQQLDGIYNDIKEIKELNEKIEVINEKIGDIDIRLDQILG